MNLYLLTACYDIIYVQQSYVIMAKSSNEAIQKWVRYYPEYNKEQNIKAIIPICIDIGNLCYFIE